MVAVISLEDKDVKTTIMAGVASNQSGEKGSLANLCVTEWGDVKCIPCLVNSANERGGGS